MSIGREQLPGEDFERKLAQLRLRIDSLPIEQRAHLYDLADVVERHHRELRTRRIERNDVE